MTPRHKFTHRNLLFDDHGTDCGCTLCGYRTVTFQNSSSGSVSYHPGDGRCWFQDFFPNKYPHTREEAADVILDKHMIDHPGPVPEYAIIPPNPKRRRTDATL